MREKTSRRHHPTEKTDMVNFEDDAQNTEENSPRKLEKDILDYLLQISQQLEKLDGGSENEEEREILIENALAELSARSRTSSAMADRTTHSIMERLVQLCSPARLGQVLSSCLSYAVFLARNRYSSHVLQAMLSRLAFLLKQDGADPGSEALSAASAASSFAAPLLQSLAWLSREISASHVIRSTVCLLSGLPVVAERKGRSSKHQHSVALSEPLERLQCDEGRFFISASCCYAVPAAFHAQLLEAVGALLEASSVAELQEMACNANSSAVLGLLVRIFSNGGAILRQAGAGEEEEAEAGPEGLCRRLIIAVLRFDPAAPPGGEDVFYGLAGDSAGSFFLQAAVECGPADLLLPMISTALLLAAGPEPGPEPVAAARQRIAEYAQDGVANFVLQSILRRLAAELSPSAPSAVRAAAEAILRALTLAADSNPLAALERERGGVVLRLLELAKALDACCSGAAVWSEKLGLLVIDAWEKAAAPPTGAGAGAGALERYLEQRLSLRSAGAAAEERPGQKGQGQGQQKKKKAEEEAGGGGGGLETTVLVAAKVLGALLGSSSARVAGILAAAVARLPADTLRQVALSGQQSRAVLDPFFRIQDSSCAEFRLVTAALLSFGLELAVHCVGHHVLRQAYDRSDLRGKEKWLQLLAPAAAAAASAGPGGGSTGSGSGLLLTGKNKSIWRATQQALSLELFLADPGQWRTACRKSSQAGQLLKVILDDHQHQQQPLGKDKDKGSKVQVQARGKAKGPAPAPASGSGKKRDHLDGDGDGDDSAEAAAEAGQATSSGKAPRKRKRKRSGRPADAADAS